MISLCELDNTANLNLLFGFAFRSFIIIEQKIDCSISVQIEFAQ